MRAVVQRVDRARVSVDGAVSGEIGRGLLVYVGGGPPGAGGGLKKNSPPHKKEKGVGGCGCVIKKI
ncbi:MAG: hypothetical protein F4X25_11065, partial [Chloroflexi bacterium]|nr:hypothetical protein [Chloroflexota bacterium]